MMTSTNFLTQKMFESEAAVMSPKDTFYCWECVTLITRTRTIDFVIKRRSYMLAFLQILVANSNRIVRQKYKDKKFRQNNIFRGIFSKKPKKVQNKQVNLIYYKILMMKMKISFMAWEQGTDVFGLFVKAIRKTLQQQQVEIIQQL